MARLVVITKDVTPAVHELGDGWITVGRGDDNIFQIMEQSVSGHHCEVRARGDELMVRDLISTNGTFINGRKISEGVVRNGEVLRLGDIELRYDSADLSAIAAMAATGFTSKMLVTRSTPGPRPAAPMEKRPPAAKLVDETKKRFQVLFVDDSMSFLDSFGGLCAEFSGFSWKIHKATSADTALSVLQNTPIDLILLDIGMPMLDGLQLLRIINRRHPGLKIAVITGNATESRREDALANGAEMFLEKPVTPEGMQSTFNMLLDLLLLKREGFTGALKHVNLQEVIQVECMSRRSWIMEVRNLDLHGQIYLEDGAVVHAVAGELSGESAFRRLMALQAGEFQLKPFQPPLQRTIGAPWEFLLMDSTQGAEEDTSVLKQAAPKTPPPAEDAAKPVAAEDNVVPLPVLEPEKPPEVSGH